MAIFCAPPSRNEAKPNPAKPEDTVVPASEVWVVQFETLPTVARTPLVPPPVRPPLYVPKAYSPAVYVKLKLGYLICRISKPALKVCEPRTYVVEVTNEGRRSQKCWSYCGPRLPIPPSATLGRTPVAISGRPRPAEIAPGKPTVCWAFRKSSGPNRKSESFQPSV